MKKRAQLLLTIGVGIGLSTAIVVVLIPQRAQAQSPKPIEVHVGTPTGPELAWKRLTDPAEVLQEQVFAKLRAGDTDWIIENTSPNSYGSLGKDGYKKVLLEQIIPYFKDFSKPVEDMTVATAECGKDRGFSFYNFFKSATGKKKAYMIEINLDKAGKQHIFGITMGKTFKDEYPNGNEKIVIFRKQDANAFIGK